MIATKLTLTNYGPFRGEHIVELSPVIYSIVARDEQDSERSNWIGKSYFMSAFRYALYGKHPGRTKDRMITDGEDEGGVLLELEGNISISRTKKRGISEQLIVSRPDKGDARQDEAQKIIDDLVGFDRNDFDASCWVRQKGSNDLVIADPATRTNTVASWMNLVPLQRAAEIESRRLLNALEEDRDISSRIEKLEELIKSVGDPKEMEEKIESLKFDIIEKAKTLNMLNEQFDKAVKIERIELFRSQLEKLVADGKALKLSMAEHKSIDELNEELTQLESELIKINSKYSEKNKERIQIRELVSGSGFDGRCPIIKQECPSADYVTGLARKMNREFEEVNCECSKLQIDLDKKAHDKTVLIGEKLASDTNLGRLKAMRDQARLLIDEIGKLEKEIDDEDLDLAEIRQAISFLQAEIGLERGDLAAYASQLENMDKWAEECKSLEQQRDSLVSVIRTHREAMAVLGRNGAQREIAVGYLAEIERGANDLLGSAGIDLSVSAKWGREGTGLATHCLACGQPFPSSVRVKECAVCGAKRGPKIVEKLELEVSSDSNGAAEDVAGLAMQISAAAWLRAKRQSAWSTMFIDEPWSACDLRIGQELASQLRSMLGGRYSFRQAFVVSHNAILTEFMPGRIAIIRKRDGSLEVSA